MAPAEKRPSAGAAQRDAWVTIQRGHAIANGVYVAAVNRAGLERRRAGTGIEFWGGTFLCDPFGVVTGQGAGRSGRKWCWAMSTCRASRRSAADWPFLRDRRIDAYAGLDKRFIEGHERE